MKKKRIILSYIFAFLFLILLHLTIKIILFRNTLLQNEKIKIENIKLSLKEIKLKNFNYKENFFSVNINELGIKPSFIASAFAFTGPGEISTNFEKRKINIQGKIKGNLINGNVNITSEKINIDQIGNVKFYGILENWGKEKFEGVVQLDGLKIKEIAEITKYNIPFDGNIHGEVFIEREKENLKDIKFDIEIKNLSADKEAKFNLSLKGKYIVGEKKAIVENGVIINQKNEKIYFSGYFSEKEFEIEFNTKEFSIEEFIKILPEQIRKRYNLRIGNSKLFMNNFCVKSSKKNFLEWQFSS